MIHSTVSSLLHWTHLKTDLRTGFFFLTTFCEDFFRPPMSRACSINTSLVRPLEVYLLPLASLRTRLPLPFSVRLSCLSCSEGSGHKKAEEASGSQLLVCEYEPSPRKLEPQG
jgi:hypothetical protein